MRQSSKNLMQNGVEALWSVEFESNVGFVGGGVVILETGRILGGDAQYYYTGTFETQNNRITATVKATRYIAEGEGSSISGGDEKEISFQLSGQTNESFMTIAGQGLDHPTLAVTARLTRRAELP